MQIRVSSYVMIKIYLTKQSIPTSNSTLESPMLDSRQKNIQILPEYTWEMRSSPHHIKGNMTTFTEHECYSKNTSLELYLYNNAVL